MNKYDVSKIKDLPTHPLFKGFPEELKDPDCFLTIEKKIDRIMRSHHRHKLIKAFVKCKRCQDKVKKKGEYIRGLGFTGVEQYQMWKKIMAILINQKDFTLG